MSMDKRIVIGRIVAPHGVRGDIRILPLTERPEQFLSLTYLLLPDGRRLTLQHARFHKNMVLATCKELTTMDEAEALRGKEVSIFAEDLPPLAAGEFYVADLIGLAVVDEEGRPVGRFKEVLSTGSTDVYAVAVPDGPDVLLPAREEFVRSIDLKAKKITVRLPRWLDD